MSCQYSFSSKRKFGNPFSVERRRDELARQKDYKKLVKTYFGNFSEIKDKNTEKFWDFLNKKNSSYNSKNPMAQHRINIALSMISDNTKILDIGFGSCSFEEKLKKSRKKINLYGLEISGYCVKKATKKFPEWVFKQGSILRIPFGNDSFEYVLALEVLEHIKPSELFRALSEVRRVLVKDGFFIVSVPLNEGLEKIIKKGQNPSAHLRQYTPSILKAELKLAGFSIIVEKQLFAFHTNYFIKNFVVRFLLPWVRKPNDFIVLAKKL